MKILLLSNKVPYPANDGSSIAIRSMVDGFLENEVELSLLSINTSKHFRNKEEILKEQPSKLDLQWVNCNTNITPLSAFRNLFSNKAFHVSRFYDPKFEDKLIQLVKEKAFDIIQVEGLSMAVYIPVLRKITKAKITLRAHNAEFQIWERTAQNESNPALRAYLNLQVKRLKKFEADTSRQIDGLVTITKEDAAIYKTLGSTASEISLPCGISLNNYKPEQEQDVNYDISYLASFDWKPNLQGLDWFIQEVWPKALKLKPDLNMAIGGRKIPDRIKNMDIQGLKVVGEVESMPTFIKSAKVNVVPLLAGSGMRIKIVENMALSRPMISTTIGAEGIEVENGKEIILADDPSDFAKEMVQLVNNKEERENMGLAARKKIEQRYDNRILGQELLEFYQSIL